MQVNKVTFSDVTPVDSYGPGFFRIAGEVIHGPILLQGKSVHPWQGFDDLTAFSTVIDKIDLILLGMGETITHPPAALRDLFDARGIGVELMPTPAACRAFNVLLAEGRRVALAAIPMPNTA